MADISNMRITHQDWVTLSIQSNVNRGLLTPLMFEKELGYTIPDSKPQASTLVNLQTISPILKQLANPQAVNGLAFTLPDYILDVSLYYPPGGSLEEVVSLSNEGEYLHLQSPAPMDEILLCLDEQLGLVQSAILPVILDLPILPAWLWWAFIDLLREALGEDARSLTATYRSETLMTVLGRPFEMLDNLSAYFRQCLDLRIPLQTEVQQALRALAKKGLLEEMSDGYKPGALLQQQALEFSNLQAHLLLKTSALLPGGSVGSMRNWIFQGKSGNGLLWHESAGTVSLIGVSRAQILYTVEKVLKEPLSFFAQTGSREPAPPKKLVTRKPPPPEKLR